MNYNQPEIESFDHDIFNQRRIKLGTRFVTESSHRNLKCLVGMPDLDRVHRLSERTVAIVQFDLLHHENLLHVFDQKLTETGREVYIITDNFGILPKFKSIKIFQKPEMIGVYAPVDDEPPLPRTPSRLYNCFIQRVDAVRQTWFYFLHHHNLIDRGYVSFLLKQLNTYSSLTGMELFDFIHKQHNLGELPHFESAYRHWRLQVPFKNFHEQYNLPSLYQDSKYSVVLETFATEDDHTFTCFTEKSIRVLQMPTIPLLFVQRNGISLLKNFGFDVGSHQLDFDHLPWQQRQQHTLEFLTQDNVVYDNELLYNRAMHNRELVTKFAQRCEHPDFFSEILDQL